jgi:hypothetical protein
MSAACIGWVRKNREKSIKEKKDLIPRTAFGGTWI